MGVVEFESFGVHEFKSSAAVVPSRMSVTQLSPSFRLRRTRWRAGRVKPPSSFASLDFRLRAAAMAERGRRGELAQEERFFRISMNSEQTLNTGRT